MPHTSATTSSAISRYGDYLEGVYSRSSVSSDGKFPPTPSKTYVNLAVVKHANEIRDIEEVRKNTLHGRVDKLLEGKTKIEIASILKPHDNGSPVSLVFVEGPPGIGKSTLAWELCRKWDRKQYDLALLLRFREREVQQIEKISGLFLHEDEQLQQSVTKEVLSREGKRILLIFDGYDELPTDSRHQGLLIKLLKGKVLPKCSVLVTSRPSATRDLFRACHPQIQRHVEILGFTKESVKDYASSVFFSEPEVLNDFLIYISASQNPALNSLMYIPLNAAIIVQIYKNCRKKGSPIPKTMTQVYTQLCLTLLQRYLDSLNADVMIVLDSFSDLPKTYYNHFKNLSQLAFEQFQQHRIVFNSDSVGKELVHFGLLDSVPALYGGGGVSYNFLHLTIQEFLAAYHITQLPSGRYIFNQYSVDERWEVVWRFLSGLTGFKYFNNSVLNPAFSYLVGEESVVVENLFLHCLFEGQPQDILKATGLKKVYSDQEHTSSPLDRYALGYCIANCSSTTSWEVEICEGSDESFMWGLNSNHSGKGTISRLMLEICSTGLHSYPLKILHGIEHLELGIEALNCINMVIPLMNNLTTLWSHGFYGHYDNNLTLTSFSNLIHSPKLKCVYIGKDCYNCTFFIKPFCDILFGPSSVNELTLINFEVEDSSFDLLATNTNLTEVFLSGCYITTPPFQSLAKLLRNRTIQTLQIDVKSTSETLDFEQMNTFKAALSRNTSLENLKLVIDSDACTTENCTHDWSSITDSRVTIECGNVCGSEGNEEEESGKELLSGEEGSAEKESGSGEEVNGKEESGEEGSGEEGSDEEESEEERSDEEESGEEESDEEESEEERSDEEESGEEESGARKEVLRKEVPRKKVARKEVLRKEVPRKKVARKEVLRKEVPRKKVARKEVLRKKVPRKEVLRKEVPRKEVARKEVLRKEVARKEVMRKEVQRKEVMRKEVQRKEVMRKKVVGKEVPRKKVVGK